MCFLIFILLPDISGWDPDILVCGGEESVRHVLQWLRERSEGLLQATDLSPEQTDHTLTGESDQGRETEGDDHLHC